MTKRTVAALLAAGMLLPTMVACDKEDRADVREVGREVEQDVDRLDKDGKDD